MDKFLNIQYKFKEKKNNLESESDILYQSKYIPNKNIIINKNIYKNINNIIKSNNFNNLFIYGNQGIGKYSLARFYIEKYISLKYKKSNLDIFDNLKNETYEIDGKEFIYKKSNYHYELILNKYNFNDFNLIVNLLKNITFNNYKLNGVKNIIVIKNIENMRKGLFKLLKIHIEKNYIYNTFILISKNTIPVEFNGLFTNIRVPCPQKKDFIKLGKNILKNENIEFQNSQLDYIYKISNNSIVNFLNILELSYINKTYEKYKDVTEDKLKFLYKLLKKHNYEFLGMIREIVMDLLTDNYDYKKILKFIMNNIINDFSDNNQKIEIINLIAECDHNISISYREIHHLEYLLVKIMNIYIKNDSNKKSMNNINEQKK